MAEEQKSGLASILSVPTLLLITALASGILWLPTALIPARPEETKHNLPGGIGTQDVEARLWQDPFEALEIAGIPGKPDTGAAIESSQASHDITQLPTQIDARFTGWNPKAADVDGRIPLNQEIKVILAMVSGGRYAEDVESRIRSRVALMAAMGTCGYRSENEERIGYVDLPWPSQIVPDSSAQNRSEGGTLALPYEWFVRRIHHPERKLDAKSTPPSNHVLVLWLRDNMFADDPAYRLNTLIGSIHAKSTGAQVKFSILGPQTSTTLRGFFPLGDWDRPQQAQFGEELQKRLGTVENSLDGAAMFSWGATTMDGLLVPGGENAACRSQIQAHLKTVFGIDFYNVTCTDDALASALLDELARRNVDPSKGRNHIALISEWDTFYGRTIPLTLAYKLERNYGNTDPRLLQSLRFNPGLHARHQLHQFSYLQGIDGKLPVRSAAPTDEAKTGTDSGKDENKRPQPEANRAEGPSQLDYIPRLADHIAEVNRHLFRSTAGEIRAIGIMGSDVYDKLLVLQALRPRFPDAVFFTTNLDARLWHPSQLKWTRNMIVASSFGLELRKKLQRDIPPFRDSYQTGQYLAGLGVLGAVPPKTLGGISPRIFEIGRNGAVDLTSPRAANSEQWQKRNFFSTLREEWIAAHGTHRDPIYPPTRTQFSSRWALRITIRLVLSSIFVFALFRRISPAVRRYTTERSETLKSALLLKIDDIRDEGKLITALRNWFASSDLPMNIRGNKTIKKFQKALESTAPEPGSSSAASSLSIAARLTIIEGLNWLIRHAALQPSGGSGGANSRPGEPKINNPDLERMRRNRQFVEKLASGAVFSYSPSFLSTWRSLIHFVRFGWIAPVVILLLFGIAVIDHQSGEGEPFSWSDGVSAWPTQFIRLLVIALSLAFIFRGMESLRRNELELSRAFVLPEEGEQRAVGGNMILRWLLPSFAGRAKDLWKEYRWLGHPWRRAQRVALMFVFYLLAIFLFATAFSGEQPMPVRGVICFTINNLLLMVAVVATIVLNFFVVDATRLCRRFIENICEAPTIYPPQTPRKYCAGIEQQADDDLEEWIDMHLIARRSAEVSKLIYYPFIILFLLIIARARYWDDWTWSPLLILVFVLNGAWALSSAVVLQRSAKNGKAKALESIQRKLLQLPPAGAEARVKRFKKIIKDVSEMKSGAFAGFTNNPILGALTLPVAGTAITFLIEFLTKG